MRNFMIAVLFCSVILSGCSRDIATDPFLIQKNQIGRLTDSTKVRALDSIFRNDSVVRYIAGDEFTGSVNVIEVYEKGGKKLLDLSPREALDSTSTISSVRIIDERYKTEKKLSVLSTFKDINENYKISKIDNLINSIVVSVNELNATFTIDKKELPASLRFDMSITIDPLQVPAKARIKYFIIHW